MTKGERVKVSGTNITGTVVQTEGRRCSLKPFL